MIPLDETEEERKKRIESSEAYHSYRRGWIDGAGLKIVRQEFENNSKEHISNSYSKGYTDGYDAHLKAMKHAEKLYGYKPNIIRA